MCVGCRKVEPISKLSRFVSVQGSLTADTQRTLPGRGMWIHPTQACWKTARKKNAFARALRVRNLEVPDLPITESS
ncbi:YlxR family protein [Brevibacterium paucivorans]|uniref:YlxR family protein n=1 Tax=Brevibacterium paucivorans TaxID=170994 RepID=UPI003B8A9737